MNFQRRFHNHRDLVEQEILREASTWSLGVMLLLVSVFFMIQFLLGEGTNLGLWTLVFSTRAAESWVRFVRLHQCRNLFAAVWFTLLVMVLSVCHIFSLIQASKGL